MREGYHCSEAMLLAAGEALFGAVDPDWVRLSTAFAGGTGMTHGELCGALSGALMIIGARHGRSAAAVDDTHGQQLAADFRAQFADAFGATRCGSLRASGYGAGGTTPCAVLVGQAARLLLDLLDESGAAS